MKSMVSVAALLALSSGLAPVSQAVTGPEAPLLPREVLFGNPERANPQISHDGRYISYCSAVGGVLNVFVAPADDLTKAKAVTSDKTRGITNYFWAYTGKHIIYVQDTGGNENFRVYAADVTTGEVKPLTTGDPIKGPDGKPIILPSGRPLYTSARIEGMSEKFPNEILVELNTRDPQFHDLYRIDVATGAATLVFENKEWAGVTTDDDFKVRFVNRFTADGSMEYLKRTDAGAFESFEVIPSTDALTTGLGGFDKTGKVVYMNDSRGRDTGALFSVDLATGKKTLVAEDPRCDVGGVITHPTEKTIQAVAFNYERTEWKVLDKSIEPDLAYLKTVRDGEVNIVDRTLDDKVWLVVFTQSDGPAYVYKYIRGGGGAGKASFLFSNRPALEKLALSKVNPVVIKSRDGLNLVSYLTLPSWLDQDKNARPDGGAIPMVLFVHGGPWARDSYGFSGYGQWLANRGYAVLQVNFRGSTGFGKNFVNAGNREWAGKMHDDLIDAVNWAVGEKIAKKDKVAIMGGSYGGYATLVGLTFTPDVFACGVDIVGPSNINTLLKSIPPDWAPMLAMFQERVGDFKTSEGIKFLESRSPLNFIDKINKPLLIGQGANDPRVKRTEADQIVAAMAAKKIPVTYVIFPDEGHGFKRPENNMAFQAVAEAFLAQNLGGRVEPFSDVLTRSTAEIPHGVEFIPGLKDAPRAAPTETGK